jgi:predicted RNase H-like HicB family nuclease
MEYKIAVQRTEDGYSASVPDLSGCWSQGSTEAEARENIQDAIREYLAVRSAVERGIADADAGRVVTHDEAMRGLGPKK